MCMCEQPTAKSDGMATPLCFLGLKCMLSSG